MELKRIFTNHKMIAATVALLLAVVVCFFGEQMAECSKQSVTFGEKRQILLEIKDNCAAHSMGEAKVRLNRMLLEVQQAQLEEQQMEENAPVLFLKGELLQQELEEISYVENYESYLGKILDGETLSDIAIFQTKDSSVEKNLEWTSRAYRKLEGTKTVYGNYLAFSGIVNGRGSSLIIFLFLCILVANFFEEEKKGLKGIFYATPKGRSHLALRRIGVLFAGAAGFTLAVYLVLTITAFFTYGGWGDLGNPVQSVPGMSACTKHISVGGYLLLYVAVHMAASFLLALILMMCLQLQKSRMMSLIGTLLFFLLELAAWNGIGEQSIFVVFKYENLFSLMFPNEMLCGYGNYKVAGILVQRELFFWVTAVLFGAAAAGINVVIGAKRKTIVSVGRAELLVRGLWKKSKTFFHRLLSKLSLPGMECYKILWGQKGILVLVLLLALLLYGMDTREAVYTGNGAYMQEVYDAYSGPVSEELTEYAAAQTAFFEELDAAYEEVVLRYEKGLATEEEMENETYKMQAYNAKRSGLSNIKNQISYLEKLKEETGIDGWFLNTKAYKILWTGDGLYEGAGYGTQEKNALYAVVVCIFWFGMLFSYDRSCGMEPVLRATKRGRESLFHTKLAIVAAGSFLLCVLIYGLRFYEVDAVYGMEGMMAPVQSLSFLEKFPLHINILTFVIILFCIHVTALTAIGCLICFCSAYFEGYRGMLIAMCALLLPSLLQYFGVPFMEKIAVTQPMIYVEALEEGGFAYSLIQYLLLLLLGALAYFFVRKKCCMEGRREKKDAVRAEKSDKTIWDSHSAP